MNNEYLSAVDTVCGECYFCEEDYCKTCPVRKTVTAKRKENEMKELYIGNAHIYFKSKSGDAEEVYRQLQEICFQNGIELCLDGEAILRDINGHDIGSYIE